MYAASELLRRRPEQVLGTYAKHNVSRIVVGAVLRRRSERNAEILILRRVAGDEYGGIEELPSGGPEPGETLGLAVIRETFEETGIAVKGAGAFLFDNIYPSCRGITAQLNFLFDVPVDSRVQVEPAEHDSYRWLTLSRLSGSDLTPEVKRGVSASLCRSFIATGCRYPRVAPDSHTG
jgi:8-oxo-dGTP diphosphatase